MLAVIVCTTRVCAVMVPEVVTEPVIISDPDKNTGIYYDYESLIRIKLPFLYKPPRGTPPAAAAVSSA